MNPALFKTRSAFAFTLLELLIVIAIVFILVAMIAPMRNTGDRLPAKTGYCMNNLKQIGVGFMMWTMDHEDNPPWQISTSADNGVTGCFLNLTSYLRQPNVFVCPSDSARKAATTNYLDFSNTNLSYFAALHSPLILTSNPTALVLAGDRHLAVSNQPVKAGSFDLTNTAAVSWTKELHFIKESVQPAGVLLFADGHASRTRTKELPEVLAKQGLPVNRMLIP